MASKLILEQLRRLDAYPKTLEDFKIKTYGGALVTIISGVIMALLFLSELHDYLKPELSEELLVDTSRGPKLRINLDLVFPHISCSFLALDAMDTSGEQHLQIEHNVYKRRLDVDGKPIEEPKKADDLEKAVQEMLHKTNNTEEKCLSCYGAESKEIECCNTCEEVREAYRRKKWAFPDPENIEQCKNEHYSEKLEAAFKEGCHIYGYMEVNRVGGSFHIAPGQSFSINHVHVHDVQPFPPKSFNTSHKIRHLSFGKNIPGKTNPIDGTEVTAEEVATATIIIGSGH